MAASQEGFCFMYLVSLPVFYNDIYIYIYVVYSHKGDLTPGICASPCIYVLNMLV
jgi:hypothetical protein